MSRTIALTGAIAASVLVFSAGAAAAQSSDLPGSSEGPGSSALGSADQGSAGPEGADPGAGDADLSSEIDVSEMFGSVTGSLPGHATGPFGSTATFVCNAGSVATLAANATGTPLPLPIGIVCMAVKPLAESADALLDGDAAGSVSAVLGGIPLIGGSLEEEVDTASATESVEGSVGDGIGTLSEDSLGS